jgi:hypothetical protein
VYRSNVNLGAVMEPRGKQEKSSDAQWRGTKPPDGVDVSLIRWLLGMSPAERLAALQGAVDSIAQLRDGGTTA